MSEPIDDALRDIHSSSAAEPPPPGAELERLLEQCEPVRCRHPHRQLLIALGCSVAFASVLAFALSLRPDLDELPWLWFAGYGAAMFAAFAIPLWLALVPPRGEVLPRARVAGLAGLAAAAAVIGLGLATARSGPSSLVSPSTMDGFAHYALPCLVIGHLTAIVPVVLGLWFMRNTAPSGTAWAAAGLGVAGGALGGVVLQLHCPVADAAHVGGIHGGMALLVALWLVIGARKILRP